MKWLSYILAFFVIVLTAQPLLSLMNEKTETFCGSSCCNEEDDTPKDSNKNKSDGNDKNCNPFKACGCCMGFTVRTSFIRIDAPAIQKSMSIIFKQHFISQYSPDVWQPPKIS